jgi:formate-dependent phosphoribosylglycinamide formyltransferase (GAR transformylase)
MCENNFAYSGMFRRQIFLRGLKIKVGIYLTSLWLCFGVITISAQTASNIKKPAEKITETSAMANLLGDLWKTGETNWQNTLAFPNIKLHLYGKAEARNNRKMGHLTAMAERVEDAIETVRNARAILCPTAKIS